MTEVLHKLARLDYYYDEDLRPYNFAPPTGPSITLTRAEFERLGAPDTIIVTVAAVDE